MIDIKISSDSKKEAKLVDLINTAIRQVVNNSNRNGKSDYAIISNFDTIFENGRVTFMEIRETKELE